MIPTLPKLPITPKELDDEVATTTFGPLEDYSVPLLVPPSMVPQLESAGLPPEAYRVVQGVGGPSEEYAAQDLDRTTALPYAKVGEQAVLGLADKLRGLAPDVAIFDDLQPAPVPPQRKMHKVPRSQLTALKKKLILQQKGRCPLSEKRFDPAKLQDAVVDHDHTTGEIRGVLSRSANAVEGKVKNAVARWGGTGENYPAIIAYLKRLVAYLEKQGTGLIYPFHRTDDEKRLDRNKAAREARAKRMAQQKLKERK